MKILVFCDDIWHPARIVRAGLAGLEKAGYHLDWIEDVGGWHPERMDAYPLVILSKGNNTSAGDETPWMTEEVEAAFAETLRRGNGLLAIHSGTVGYEDTAAMRGILGGVFVHHPEQCPVTATPLRGHPLAEGVEPFTQQDEHYHMALDDEGADVFLRTSSKHGEQPGGWTRVEFDGRVGVLTPGHNLAVWQQPSYQRLILNTARWCAKLD